MGGNICIYQNDYLCLRIHYYFCLQLGWKSGGLPDHHFFLLALSSYDYNEQNI